MCAKDRTTIKDRRKTHIVPKYISNTATPFLLLAAKINKKLKRIAVVKEIIKFFEFFFINI